MTVRVLADLVLVVHFGFVVFVAAGGLLVLRRRWLGWVHAPAALWGAAIELVGGVCPLTPLENRLRAAAGKSGYEGGFIEHYILPIVYPEGLTRTVQLSLGGLVLLLNGMIYWWIWKTRTAKE